MMLCSQSHPYSNPISIPVGIPWKLPFPYTPLVCMQPAAHVQQLVASVREVWARFSSNITTIASLRESIALHQIIFAQSEILVLAGCVWDRGGEWRCTRDARIRLRLYLWRRHFITLITIRQAAVQWLTICFSQIRMYQCLFQWVCLFVCLSTTPFLSFSSSAAYPSAVVS